MIVTRLEVGHIHVRPLIIRVAFILIRVCGLFVRLRPVD